MDTTEQRSGFRLPWTERRERDGQDVGAPDQAVDAEEGAVVETQMAGIDVPATEDPVAETELAAPEADAGAGAPETGAPAPDAVTGAADAPRRQSRFLADLTRAMHTAAEEGRRSALEQFHADGKRTVEELQSRSAEDAASIRHTADEDVAGVREWSKAEIARIREETERRIAERKAFLDRQLEGHAAVVEREIENVQEQIVGYESQMAAFFDELLAEPDPGHFAALAASLPEPPSFTPVSEDERRAIEARAIAGLAAEEPEATEAQEAADAPIGPATDGSEVATQPVAGAPDAQAAPGPAAEDSETPADAESDADAAAIDARLSALGDLAEAERAARADVAPDEAAFASHTASLSARLAGLVSPTHADSGAAQPASAEGPVATTQVVVTGLTSVASIAAFKRQLGRLDGVRSVAVSSGPSEEFVFAVAHVEDHSLADGIASLTGFAPRIDRADAGEILVAARDPES